MGNTNWRPFPCRTGHLDLIWCISCRKTKWESDVYTPPISAPALYTGCLVGLGTFPAGTVGLGTHFCYKLTILGQNTYFCSVFNEFGVCCWNLCFWQKCYDSAYIPGFWVCCVQTLFSRCLRFFFEMPIFIVFGGLTPIDWTSRPLLQSFNFRSFFVVFGLKSVWLE